MGDIFGKTLTRLKDLMDYHMSRQGVISSNLANQDTPGYKAKDLTFEKELETRLTLKRTDPAHKQISAGQIQYRTHADPYARIGNDGNTVDMDREMMKIAQSSILYDASVQTVLNKLEGLKNVLAGIR